MNEKNLRVIACPQCKKSTVYDKSNPSRPFCSERCKLIDTAAWAEQSYCIEGQSFYSDLEGVDGEDG